MSSYVQLDKTTRAIAEEVLAPRQLEVFKLWMNGFSTGKIGMALGISESVARRTRDRAVQLVSIELARRKAA